MYYRSSKQEVESCFLKTNCLKFDDIVVRSAETTHGLHTPASGVMLKRKLLTVAAEPAVRTFLASQIILLIP